MTNKTYTPPLAAVLAGLLVCLLCLVTVSCTKHQYSTKNLSPSEAEFISQVRYIITKQERKAFFSLVTSQERQEFIKRFWKERDPDPASEENEFQDTYFQRIDEANLLFRDSGKSGWLSDRGRIHILLGPPEMRRFKPGVISAHETNKLWYHYPHEIWYYGYYPIVFIDRLENGTFQLLPSSGRHLAIILQATMAGKPIESLGKGTKIPYDFTAKVHASKSESYPAILVLNIPYENILFKEEDMKKGEASHFTNTISVHVEVLDGKNKKALDVSKDFTISLTQDQLKDSGTSHVLKLPLNLKPGKYNLKAVVESKSDQLHSLKKVKFEI